MVINAADYGIKPNAQAGKALNALFKKLSETNEEKTLVFEKGDYYICSADCESDMLFITNTAGDNEYRRGETPHKAKVAFNLKNIKNLKIEGNGASFIIDGKVTNAAIQGCENIEINDIEIDAVNPDLHELKVTAVGNHYVDFEVDKNSVYEVHAGKLCFSGTDYRINAIKKYRTAWHLSRVRKDSSNQIERTHNLFSLAVRAKDLGNRKIRIYYLKAVGFELGDKYYCFDNRRQYVGIFSDQSKNITLNHVSQHFNYALAFVAQNTENITLKQLDFTPSKKTGRLMTSLADFLQICMCRGAVSITDSNFEGSCDDCLNVHGVHFKISKIEDNTVTVRFMHRQSHGYNPFRTEDTVAFINTKTLLEKGTAAVLSSKLINEYEIELKLTGTDGVAVGDVIEDVSACPELCFKNNTINRIATRAILITNRPKTVIEGNRFINNSMSGILLSDDASSWYESGMCRDVVIQNNIFERCGETGVRILPENKVHEGFVHSNIKILNNEFRDYKGACITAKSTENIEITGNRFADENRLELTNCGNVKKDF